jgi:hypothetical protein
MQEGTCRIAMFMERRHLQISTVIYTDVNAVNAKPPMHSTDIRTILVSLPLLPKRLEDESRFAGLIYAQKRVGENIILRSMVARLRAMFGKLLPP